MDLNEKLTGILDSAKRSAELYSINNKKKAELNRVRQERDRLSASMQSLLIEMGRRAYDLHGAANEDAEFQKIVNQADIVKRDLTELDEEEKSIKSKYAVMENSVNNGGIIKPIKCNACGAHNEVDAAFCIKCGSPITTAKSFCSNCGSLLDAEQKFCTICGTAVNDSEDTSQSLQMPESKQNIGLEKSVENTEKESETEQTVQKDTVSFCENCGAKISAEDDFCVNCGMRIVK